MNKGTIFRNGISLKASQDIIQSDIIEGENKVFLDAERNISMKSTIQHGKNQDMLDTTAGIAVQGKEGMLFLQTGKNITLIRGLSWQPYMKTPLVGQFHHGYKDDLANKKDTTKIDMLCTKVLFENRENITLETGEELFSVAMLCI